MQKESRTRYDIGVIVRPDNPCGRGFLQGFLSVAAQNPSWNITISTGRNGDVTERELFSTELAAVVTDDPADCRLRYCQRRRIPLLALIPTTFKMQELGIPTVFVTDDSASCGTMAADFLKGQGYERFAYVPTISPCSWSDDRQLAFLSAVEIQTPVFSGESLPRWLERLPHGTAVFAANDSYAMKVIFAARSIGLSIPEDLAVIGVDDDPLFCETATPSITSIRMDTIQAGFKAGDALSRILLQPKEHRSLKPLIIRAKAIAISKRKSTGFIHADAQIIHRVHNLIELGYTNRLTLRGIASELGMSVRTLERRYKRASGQTLMQAISGIRLSHANDLLEKNAYSLQAVAKECGFYDASHLSRALQRHRANQKLNSELARRV